MRAEYLVADIGVNGPRMMAILQDLDIVLVTMSYRPDVPGLHIEFSTEIDAVKAAVRVGAERIECSCEGEDHEAAYRQALPYWPMQPAVLILSWTSVKELTGGQAIPDDTSELTGRWRDGWGNI